MGWGFTLQCISSLLLGVPAPSGQMVLSPLSFSWLCRFPREHHDNALSLFMVIWKPLLGTTLPIFQTDIFLPSRWHPHPVALSMVVEPGAVAACRHISHASMAVIPVTIAVMVASFLFDAGSLIFFLCKGSPSVIRQVPVARLLIPTQIFQQPSAFSF